MFGAAAGLTRKLLGTFILVFVLFFLAMGIVATRVLERQVIANAERLLGVLVESEGNGIEDYFRRLEAIGKSSARTVAGWLGETRKPLSAQDFDVRFRVIGGALRTDAAALSDPDASGVFLSSRGRLTPEVRRTISATEGRFDEYARAATATVFNMYLITQDQLIRIYRKDWALEIEPDHDFAKDVFYYAADPQHNPGGEPVWTDPYYDSIWRHWMTSLITPVYVGGRFSGIVGHDVILDDLYKGIFSKRFLGSGYGLLFDGKGNILVNPKHVERLRETAEMGAPLASRTSKGDGALETAIRDMAAEPMDLVGAKFRRYMSAGREYHVVACRLGVHDWSYAVVVPQDALLQFLPRFQRGFAVGSVAATVLLFLATALLLWSYVLSPINSLKRTAEAITGGDLDQRATVAGRDEIGQMALSFNAMTERLSHTLLELREDIQERERAEQELGASEERYRSLVANIPVGLYSNTPGRAGRFATANPAIASMFGYDSVEAFLEVSVADLYQRPEDRELFAARLAQEGAVGGAELQLRRRDGTPFWGAVSARAVRDAGGSIVYFDGMIQDVTARKCAEEELTRHQQLLASVLDNTDNALLAVDRDLRAVFHNHRFLQLWGFTEQFMASRPGIEELIHQACGNGLYPRDRADELIAARLQHLESRSARQVIDTPRQDGLIVEGYATSLPDGGHLLAYRDVTRDKEAERALRAQREFSLNLVESCAVATFVLDPDHKVLFWNKACEELTGVPARNVVGTSSHWKAFYPAGRPCLADLVIDGRQEGARDYYKVYGPSTLTPGALHGEGWYSRLGGLTRYIAFDAAPIHREDGTLAAVVETIQDITSTKRAEEARALLTTAVEQAAEAIVVTDTEGLIRSVNPAFSAVTGYQRDEVLGRPAAAFDNFEGETPEDLIAQSRNQDEIWKGYTANRRKDGTVYERHTTVSPVLDERGQIRYHVAVHRDVTLERTLERRVAEGQKLEALGTLAGGIAHDFNNILAAMMGFTELALDDAARGSVQEQNLENVLTGAKRARDLVRHILTFSCRRDAEEEEPSPIALGPLVEETMQFLRASIPTTIDVRWDVRSPDVSVLATPSQIHQVLMNLCANAAQAMGPQEGVLEVTVSGECFNETQGATPVRPCARLTVQDSGPGIPPEIQGRIFEPFFTTKPVGQGSGMGLSVVHGIVRSLGGDIHVQSDVGAGAVFQVELPVAGFADQVDEVPDGPTPGGSARILLVDDEPDVADVLGQMLKLLGYDVVVENDPTEALRNLREDQNRSDLLITDLTMPSMTGLDLAREARVAHPGLPVILCTGYSPLLSDSSMDGLEPLTILDKPMSRHALAQAVTMALEKGAASPSRAARPFDRSQ